MCVCVSSSEPDLADEAGLMVGEGSGLGHSASSGSDYLPT